MKLKKYKLLLYEAELVMLYRNLRQIKPHLPRIESMIEDIFKSNKEFNNWKTLIEEKN